MTETLPTAAIDTITTMAFGRKVLMIGTAFGQDVLALAHSAQILACYTLPRGEQREKDTDAARSMYGALAERGQAGHVLVHAHPWDTGLSAYLTGQFDLAVINPGALGEDDPRQLIEQVTVHAGTVIVIEPSGATWWDQVTAATAGKGMLCTGDGSIIVARPMPTEPVVRRD